MTTIKPKENFHHNPYLDAPNQPIYAVCRLMRQLPHDITNVGPLTRDQSQMAAAVSYYADIAHDIVIEGLAEIGKLMFDAHSGCCDSVPLGRLIQHLSMEAQFMQEAAADYGDASLQACR